MKRLWTSAVGILTRSLFLWTVVLLVLGNGPRKGLSLPVANPSVTEQKQAFIEEEGCQLTVW